MKSPKFIFGFGFVLVGLALACGINYLDMRQFETQIPGIATAGWRPTDASGIYQSLKSNDEFSKKYFTPEISTDLLRDYSTMGDSIKSQFQHVRDAVSQKKSRALKDMCSFLFLASLTFFNFSYIRKSQSRQASFMPSKT